jgi:decaprenyl-phosphate phosphoribosyltransferase
MTTTGPRQSETATQLGGALSGLVRTMRPRHWVKNVVVLAAPAASGTLFEPPVLAAVGIAFVAFSLAASGVYIVNDPGCRR